MTEFTKDIWEVIDKSVPFGNGKERSNWFLVGSHESAVGFIRHKEDARLIAAAPEMYEVLKKAYEWGHLNWSLDNGHRAKEILDFIDGGSDCNNLNSL